MPDLDDDPEDPDARYRGALDAYLAARRTYDDVMADLDDLDD